MNKLPNFISRLFDPLIVITLAVTIVATQSYTQTRDVIVFLVQYGLFILLPPVLLLVGAIKTKKISDWDVSNRKQRVKVFLVFFLLLVFDVWLVGKIGNVAIKELLTTFFVWFIGFMGITLFWKISGHIAVLTFASVYLGDNLNDTWYFLLFSIPFLGWARVALQRHTVGQVIGGLGYSIVFFVLFPLFKAS